MKKNLILSVAIGLCSVQVSADQVVLDDQIVTGSLCVGAECVDGEVFGYDSIKLKTNDPQIGFEDTSNSGGFPTNDWAMGITDNGVAAPAHFFINDTSGNATVLLLEAGATGGIALGAGATAETNAVSVGAAGTERRIVHVADGVADSDAATLGQLNTYIASVDSATAADRAAIDTELATLQDSVGSLSTRIDALIARLNGN